MELEQTSQQSDSASSSSQSQAPQPDQQSQQTSTEFKIPEKYGEQSWAKNIKSHDDLFDQFANAQNLIGKKALTPPAPDAPDEVWDAYLDQTTRPKDMAAYALQKPEGIPAEMDLSPYETKAKEIFHKAGLSPHQASRLWKDYIATEMEHAKTSMEKSSQADDGQFDTLAKKYIGDNYSAQQDAAVKLIGEVVPEGDLRNAIKDAPPVAQVALISALSAMQSKMEKEISDVKSRYGAEDTLKKGEGSTGGQDIATTRKELAELRTSEASRNFMHKDHKQVSEKIKALQSTVDNYYRTK